MFRINLQVWHDERSHDFLAHNSETDDGAIMCGEGFLVVEESFEEGSCDAGL